MMISMYHIWTHTMTLLGSAGGVVIGYNNLRTLEGLAQVVS